MPTTIERLRTAYLEAFAGLPRAAWLLAIAAFVNRRSKPEGDRVSRDRAR